MPGRVWDRVQQVTPTDETVREHLAYTLRLARMLVGNATIAEDVASESVARLLAARRRTSVDDPKAYLRRIVVNQVVGRRRRHATEQRLGHRFVTPASAVDRTEQIATATALSSALDALPVKQRAVLVLRFYEDLPEKAVARVLHVPIGTVKSTCARALAELRRQLSEVQHDG